MCLLEWHQVESHSINIACDPISDYKRGRKYCILKYLKSNESTAVTYEPSFFATFKVELIFDNCTIHAIPSGIFKAFPNLKTMYVWNSGLRQVSKEDFRNASSLRQLELCQNKIQLIDDSTFFWAIDLELIDLSHNLINQLEEHAFLGLTELRTLYLNHNQIENLAPRTFNHLPKLKVLHLQENRIRAIDGRLFLDNHNLNEVLLNDNDITTMNGSTFEHLRHLNRIDIQNNPIKEFDCLYVDAIHTNIQNISARGCFVGNRTEKLFASNNLIAYVIVTVTHKLLELDLANNELREFQNLTDLDNLRELDLSNNYIRDIGLNSFSSMTKLIVLRLRNSGLRAVNFGLFSHKPKLRILDISYNQLGRIDLNMFTALTNVRSLYLEGNDIIQMDMTGIRNYFPILRKIGISKNKWHCTNLALAIKVLEANNIELNAVGLTRNTSNIKGIPCTNIQQAVKIPTVVVFGKSLPEAAAPEALILKPTTTTTTTTTPTQGTIASIVASTAKVNNNMPSAAGGAKPQDDKTLIYSGIGNNKGLLNFDDISTVSTIVSSRMENTREKCRVNLATAKDMGIVIQLVELKYEIAQIYDSIFKVSEKIELIVDLMDDDDDDHGDGGD